MRFFSLMGNSFGCSASGERLVSAARDGDLQEAKALLEYNPRLARYSTFGVRNSPLHYSASQGHHEIVSLLLESGVDINLRNFRGQTALMQACHIIRKSTPEASILDFDEDALSEIVNRRADGGITAIHMAALNGHAESVHLLLDLGASISDVTLEDGTTIDLIGAGSTPLHYAACGGNAVCCQVLIARGSSLTAQNANGLTPLMVARSWNRNWLEGILSRHPEGRIKILPSPYLSLPLMSIIKIARECGWRNACQSPACIDPCVVCLERRCTVASEGCGHEFCTRCALYLCSTNIASTVSGPPGSIPCPLCRHAIVLFNKVAGTSPVRELPRTSLSLSLCTTCPSVGSEPSSSASMSTQLCKPDLGCTRIPQLGSSSFRSLSCQRFPSMKLTSTLCMRADTSACLIRCSRSGLPRSSSQGESSRRSWLFASNQYVTTGSSG